MIDRIAKALLYEGYVLYPYRADSTKNRQRFQFGTLHPRTWCDREASDTCSLTTEVLVRGAADHSIRVRFLQLLPGEWQQAREHDLDVPARDGEHRLSVPGGEGSVDLAMRVSVSTTNVTSDLRRVRVEVTNESKYATVDDDLRVRRHEVNTACLAAVHVVFTSDAEFISLLEPPPELAEHAAACANDGVWPVLVGDAHTMLASPVILYDFPAIAPESVDDLCDATEIDEILTLRILTLSDEEREKVRALDPRARAILERCERMSPGEMAALHGRTKREGLLVGDRVVVHPKPGADAIDTLLANRTATVVAVEQELEGRYLFAVTFDDDPGREQPIGHRFFFRSSELERLT